MEPAARASGPVEQSPKVELIRRRSFDHLVGERPGNERFDAQNKFKLVCLFDSSHLCRAGL